MKKSEDWLERAERELRTARDDGKIPDIIVELVDELHVHQIELEMQNEELNRSQRKMSDLYKQYRELYNELPVGYFILDEKGLIKRVNKKGVELLGLEKDRIKNQWFGRFIPQSERYKYHQNLTEAIANNRIHEFELQLKRGQSLFYAQIKISPLQGKDSGKYRIIIEDITKRRQMENNLAENHALLEAVKESSKGPIFSVDRKYHYTSFNSRHKEVMKQLYGADIEIGYSILDYYTDPVDREKAKERIDRSLRGESFYVEDFLGGKSQNRRYFLISNNPVRDASGNVMGCAAYYQDLTARKNAEEAFVKKKEELQTIIDSTRTYIFYKDKENRYLQVNKAFAEELDLPQEELEGMSLFDIFDYEQAERYWKSDKEVIESGKPKFDIVEPMVYKNHAKWIQTDKIPYYDEHDNIIGIIGFSADITERKQHEKQLRYSMDELKRSNEELEQFAYVASHDLQEPLRMVGSFTQLLEKRYKGELDDDADDYIAFIVDGANRMKDLIDDLLTFSRLNTHAKEFKSTDLENVLNDVLADIQTSIDKNNVIITYDPLPTIKCDPSQLNQLFQNLIVNAIKFQDEKPPIIHISAEELEKDWLFGVHDNGIGIAPEHQKQIFKVFNRLHTRAEYEGTGIGLAICNRIVNRHNGKIWVESELGKGSTFYFTIPK